MWLLATVLLAGRLSAAVPRAVAPSDESKLTNPAEIHRRWTNGLVEVLVMVAPPVPPGAVDLRSPAVRAQVRSQMHAAQQVVLDAVPAADLVLRHRFDNLPGFWARVSTNGLRALQAHPAVQSIEPVLELQPHLAQGIALIRGLTYRPLYYGQGVAIAICDTGVDYTHPRLGGGGFPNAKVIGGYDFGDGDADPMPNAQGHGTACAGIAAGDPGTVGDYIGGVAPGARLYALKITAGTGSSATTAAMTAAWDWCVTHRDDDPNNPLLVISTSFGSGRYFSPCDTASPSMTAAAENATAAGITVLASSGNDGYCDSLSWPACISSVVSVGAVYDAAFGSFLPCISADSCAPKNAGGGCSSGWYAVDSTAPDKVAVNANVASFLTLFAPANQCYTLDLTGPSGYASGDYYATFGGTSAACPYAAGAVACLQSAAKALTGQFLSPASIRTLLLDNGDNVTDTKVAITRPRINLERAILALDTNTVARFIAAPTNGAAPLSVAFTNQSSAATNFLWDFGDGIGANVPNPTHTYSNAGVYSVQLVAVGLTGTNTLTRTNYITVTNAPPQILLQPQNRIADAGSDVTFSVTASGTPPLQYQWRRNGTNLPGATLPGLTLSNVQPADMGFYSVQVSNAAGSVVSSNASLLVVVLPGFITVTGLPYIEDFDSMGASGTTAPYGWYVGIGTGAISGKTVLVGDGGSNSRGNYNFGSTGQSDRALGSLAGDGLTRNTEARFVNWSGLYLAALQIRYTGEQWRRGGNNSVNNQLVLQFSTNGSSFTPLGESFNFNTPLDAGRSSALDGNAPASRVTGLGGTFIPPDLIGPGEVFYLRWSDPDDPGFDHGIALDDLVLEFVLTNPPPRFTVQPASQTAVIGSEVTFSAEAVGLPPLSWQWRFNGADIAGATGTALTLTNVQFSDAGEYTAVVSNSGGTTTSAVGTLTVIWPAPVADFTAQPTNGTPPLMVAFTNLSQHAAAFLWEFGDGDTSTEIHPVHLYTNAGRFTVTLTAIGPGGTNSLTRSNFVLVLRPPQMLVSPDALRFGNVLTGRVAQASFVVSNAGDLSLSGSAVWADTPGSFALLDAESNPIPALAFELEAGGVTNVAVRFAPQTPGGFTSAIVFSSNGGATTNPVSGVAVGAPLIAQVSADGTNVVLAFESVVGLTYVVELTDSLDPPEWHTLEVLPGNGAVLWVTNSLDAADQRFYRLRVE